MQILSPASNIQRRAFAELIQILINEAKPEEQEKGRTDFDQT